MQNKIIDCGIYKIINKINGKLYVGSSKHIHQRWDEHEEMLVNNRHHSIKLQRAWNKYGKDNFKFDIIQECKESELLDVEQRWIDELDSFKNGYNCTNDTKNPFKEYDKTNKEETLEKYHNILLEMKQGIYLIITEKAYYERMLEKTNKKTYDYKRIATIMYWFKTNFDISKYILYIDIKGKKTTNINIQIWDMKQNKCLYDYIEKTKTIYYIGTVLKGRSEIIDNTFKIDKENPFYKYNYIGKTFSLDMDNITYLVNDDIRLYFEYIYHRNACELHFKSSKTGKVIFDDEIKIEYTNYIDILKTIYIEQYKNVKDTINEILQNLYNIVLDKNQIKSIEQNLKQYRIYGELKSICKEYNYKYKTSKGTIIIYN